MPSITVKKIPEDLYEQLRQLAAANHRSMNSEIIVCIEHAVRSRDKTDVETILACLRERIGELQISDKEFTVAKRTGRP